MLVMSMCKKLHLIIDYCRNNFMAVDQAKNAKDMVPMQMAYENLMDLSQSGPVFAKLHLCTFPTID